MSQDTNIRRRDYVWTVNNPTDLDIDMIHNLPETRYFVYGREVGAGGTYHLQGYVEFKAPIRFSSVKAFLPRAHIEIRRGTREEARDYCMKDNDYFEHGEWVTNGKRKSLDECKRLLDEGKSQLEIAHNYWSDWVRYHKSFQLYASMTIQQEMRDVHADVYWGVSGAGKTYKAFTENKEDAFILTRFNNGVWFDGYTGQKVLIIDDFNGWIPFKFFLRILDDYPLIVETKGSTAVAMWNKVIITSNTHPTEWYHSIENLAPLLRRLENIEEFKEVFTDVTEEVDCV